MKTEELFQKYKNVTLAIIEAVKAENYEILDDIFSKRQLILENINQLGSSKEELNEHYIKCDICKIEKMLEDEMKSKKEEVLSKIKKNQVRKTAMNGYNNLQAKAVFLSRVF